jgi:hypothetical protein
MLAAVAGLQRHCCPGHRVWVYALLFLLFFLLPRMHCDSMCHFCVTRLGHHIPAAAVPALLPLASAIIY